MVLAGIDGCKQGWILIKYDQKNYSYGVYERLSALAKDQPDLQRVLIDMPIGLSSKIHPRSIEKVLRAELLPRQATVFNPPCRAALKAKNYAAAKKKNIAIEGKSLSIQSFFIQAKIKELDDFLQQRADSNNWIESHPELCFKYLNRNHQVVLTKKSTPEGIEERLRILTSFEPSLKKLYEQILEATLRKNVQKDDILDAMCLCLANQLGKQNLTYLSDEHSIDDHGIPIRIAYHATKR